MASRPLTLMCQRPTAPLPTPRARPALAGFVDAFARRIAGFDKVAVAGTKALLDVASLPPGEEFGPSLAAFFRTSGRPENAAMVRYLFENGLQTSTGVKRDLGRAVGSYSDSPA